MAHILILKRAWRYRDRARGATELAPGKYKVPEEIDKRSADLAVMQGMGDLKEISAPPVAPDAPVAPVAAPASDGTNSKRKRAARRKGPAPENQALAGAPENKLSLV